MPVSLGIESLLLGLVLLWLTKWQRTGKTLSILGVVLLLAFSYSPIPDTLLRPLEYRYSTIREIGDLDGVEWVVVLGGGHISDARLPANTQLSRATLTRLVEGIRIHRLLPNSRLLLSGGSFFGKISNAEVMAEAALGLGVDKSHIVLESLSKDTKDEAMLVGKMVVGERFVLVTSAAHMHRSMALFEKLGMKPIPAPTDYLAKKDDGSFTPGMFFPSANHLQKAESAFHEYLGMVWAWMRGQI